MTIGEFYKKTTSYWQAVLRVGVPIIIAYRATNYLIFYVEKGAALKLHYPWRFALIMDVITVFILSTLWWSLMRSVFGMHRRGENTNEAHRGKQESPTIE